MNTERIEQRTGGLANIVGGVLVGIAYTLHPHSASAEVVASTSWLVIHVLFALSLLCGIYGAIGLYQRHRPRSSGRGFAGLLLVVSALIGIFGLNYFEAFVNPVLAGEVPGFVDHHGAGNRIGLVAWLFPLSGLLFLAGYLLLLLDMLRARSLDQRALWLTLAGTLLFSVGLGGLLPMVVVQAGSLLFGAGLVALGVAMFATPEVAV